MSHADNEVPAVRISRRPRQAVPEIAAGGLVAIIAAGAVAWDWKHPLVLAWLALILSLYAIRFWSARRPERAPTNGDDAGGTYRRLRLSVLFTGLAWGLASSGALWVNGVSLGAISLLSASFFLAVFSLGNYQGAADVLVPFTLGVAIPPVFISMAQMAPGTVTVALMGVAVMATVLGASRVLDRFARQAISIQAERDELYSQMRSSQQLIQKLKLGVKTNEDRQAALKDELSKAQSELRLVKRRSDALSAALQRVTPYDAETGLLNAKKFGNVLDREWARMLRQEMPITLVYASLDNFDEYCSTYGTVAHEGLLRRLGEVIRRTGSRPGDVAGRLSDDRFALLLPEADHKNGNKLAESMRAQLRRLNIPNANSPLHSIITASFGVATVIPNSDVSLKEFCERSSSALYEAQFQGGDKVVRFRTMSTIRLERWDCSNEGDVTRERLIRKLSVLGYDAKPKTYKPGAYMSDRRVPVDMVDAIVKGQLSVSLEGESTVLNPGDCLFIPKGIVTSMEVVGDKPVVCLEAIRV